MSGHDRRRWVRAAAAIALGVACVAAPRPARAQVRGDAEILAGAQARFLSDTPPGGAAAAFGPALWLEGHIAIFPLLRVGAYATGEVSATTDGVAPRGLFGGGLRIKITPPWPRRQWRSWFAAGFGYVGAYSAGYDTTIAPNGNAPQPVRVDAAGGGFFEVPLSVGVSYRFRKPWQLFFELTSRIGFGFTGSLYGDAGAGGGRSIQGKPGAVIPKAGDDIVSVGLAVGVGFDL